MIVKFLAIAIVLLCGRGAHAQQTTETEFWPEVDLYMKLNEKSRLFFVYSATRQNDLKTYDEGMVGAHIDFYTLPWLRFKLREHPDASRDKFFMLRVGYLFTRLPSQTSSPTDEHTLRLENNARFPLPWKMLLTQRNRGDLQFEKGIFKPRYRNRLQLERPFVVHHIDVRPYSYAEVFYDWQHHKFNRFRFAAGTEIALSRFIVIDAYYVRQKTTTSLPGVVNAIGLKVQFYIR